MRTTSRTTTDGASGASGASAYSNYNLPAGYAAEITVRFHPLGKNKKPSPTVTTVVYYVTANSVAALNLLVDSEKKHQNEKLGTIGVYANPNYFTVTRPSKH